MSIIIGICGGSGAGKTFLANLLKEHYRNELVIISFDQYCKDQSTLSIRERGLINYDCPDAYDGDLLARDLIGLKSGRNVRIPQFDFPTHTRKKETLLLKPAKFIIIEGIMAFSFPSVNKELDYKIYVDASESIRYSRRLKRDIEQRGRTPESVNRQFYGTVIPMHKIYIEPWKDKSDFVLWNNENNGLDIKTLVKIFDNLR